jgi:hypothetical protein
MVPVLLSRDPEFDRFAVQAIGMAYQENCYGEEDLSIWNINKNRVALGGLVVSMLATGPKVAGSNPAEDDGF